MCNMNCIIFGTRNLYDDEIRNKTVLEVGSRIVLGSLRPFIESRHPDKYVGIDIVDGTGVDVVCDAEKLLDRFQVGSFDVVVSTELLEHIRDWKKAISNIKHVCRTGGIIMITTRSIGFKIHGFPKDFWRYELSDIEAIFSDCHIEALEKDSLQPGVFVKVTKPAHFEERDLSDYRLFSIVTGRRTKLITDEDLRSYHFRKLIIESRIRSTGWSFFNAIIGFADRLLPTSR